jgi:hypothetical protein
MLADNSSSASRTRYEDKRLRGIDMSNRTFKALALVVGLALVLLLGNYSHGLAWPWSKGSIKGTVVDFDNVTSTLDGVEVTVEENEKSMVTDELGEFRFKNLSSGTYTLSFKRSGFEPKSLQVRVKAGKVEDLQKVQLWRRRDIFSAPEWSRKTAKKLQELLNSLDLGKRRILLAFYKKSGSEQCDLPNLVVRFATDFNSGLGTGGNQIVTRDRKQASYLVKELKEQHQFRVDFDPATVARIGKKLGANTVIIGALLERKGYYEPLVNGTSVEQQAYIPGLSINNILLKKGEARCD